MNGEQRRGALMVYLFHEVPVSVSSSWMPEMVELQLCCPIVQRRIESNIFEQINICYMERDIV